MSVLPPFTGSDIKVTAWISQYEAQVKGSLPKETSKGEVEAMCAARFAQYCHHSFWEVLEAQGVINNSWAEIKTHLTDI